MMLSAFPSGKLRPTDEDDPFWDAALAAEMPITIHIDIDRSGPNPGPLVDYPKRPPGQADIAQQVARFAQRGAVNAVQLMIAGVFDRYPSLKILMAENQIGWVPTFMTVADERYDRHLYWAEQLLGFKELPNGHPSDYIKRHIVWGFQRDPRWRRTSALDGHRELGLGLRFSPPRVRVPELEVGVRSELRDGYPRGAVLDDVWQLDRVLPSSEVIAGEH